MSIYTRNALLISLSAYAVYALLIFANRNGTLTLATEASSRNRLPGSDLTYPTEFTRIARLDEFLKGPTTFFWPMVNGHMPGSSLMCFYFAGQGIAAWVLTVLEGLREQNVTRWSIISFTTTFGLLFQALGIAVVGPLFFALAPLSGRWPAVSFERKRHELDAIVPSIVTGLLVPTVLMSLHAPSVLSITQKVDAIRLWQFFPLLCYTSMWIWTPIVGIFRSTSDITYEKRQKSQLGALRRVYRFGIYSAMFTHIGTICVSFIATMSPHLFAEGVAAKMHPRSLFVPASPMSDAKAINLEQGAHWFLQWDMVIMFCTFLVWTFSARVRLEPPGSMSRKIRLGLRVFGYCVIIGPVGASLLAIRERDEIGFEDASKQLRRDEVNR